MLLTSHQHSLVRLLPGDHDVRLQKRNSFSTLAALACWGCLLLAACGVAPEATWPAGAPPRNATIGGSPITLRVWMAADYATQPPILDLVADFERAYPNIRIEVTSYTWEDMPSKVRLA